MHAICHQQALLGLIAIDCFFLPTPLTRMIKVECALLGLRYFLLVEIPIE